MGGRHLDAESVELLVDEPVRAHFGARARSCAARPSPGASPDRRGAGLSRGGSSIRAPATGARRL